MSHDCAAFDGLAVQRNLSEALAEEVFSALPLAVPCVARCSNDNGFLGAQLLRIVGEEQAFEAVPEAREGLRCHTALKEARLDHGQGVLRGTCWEKGLGKGRKLARGVTRRGRKGLELIALKPLMSIDESRVLHEVAVHYSQGIKLTVDLLKGPFQVLVGVGFLHLGAVVPKVLLGLVS